MQSFEDCRNAVLEPSKAVHSTLKKGVTDRGKSSLFCTIKSGRMLWTNIPNDRVDGETIHQPAKLFRRHGTEFTGVPGPGKVTIFNALVKKQKSISFPEQSLNLGSGFPAEEKEGIGNKQIHAILLLNNGGQGIDAVSKIRITTYYVDSCEVIWVSISKHSAPP